MIETEADLHKANLEYVEANWYFFLASGLAKAVDVIKLKEAHDEPK